MIDEEEFLAGYEVATKRRKHPCKHYERTENVCDAVPNIVQNLASGNSTLPDVREMSQFASKEGRKSSRAKHELTFPTQSQGQNFGATKYTKNIVKGRIRPLNA